MTKLFLQKKMQHCCWKILHCTVEVAFLDTQMENKKVVFSKKNTLFNLSKINKKIKKNFKFCKKKFFSGKNIFQSMAFFCSRGERRRETPPEQKCKVPYSRKNIFSEKFDFLIFFFFQNDIFESRCNFDGIF